VGGGGPAVVAQFEGLMFVFRGLMSIWELRRLSGCCVMNEMSPAFLVSETGALQLRSRSAQETRRRLSLTGCQYVNLRLAQLQSAQHFAVFFLNLMITIQFLPHYLAQAVCLAGDRQGQGGH
jgi:hypothetical protein